MKRFVLVVLGLAIAAYGGIVAYMGVYQRDLLYNPVGDITSLSDTAISGGEDVSIPSGDGAINGWYVPPPEEGTLIVYFKGNSASFSAEHARYAQMQADGYGVLAFDYRGYPASEGEISEANILADALAAFDWADSRHEHVVIWGRSLGSGVATHVASVRDAGAVLLESPFYSAVAVAAERYPLLPVGLVMFDQFRSDLWIAGVEEPVHIVHGTEDVVVSVGNGERLAAITPNLAGLDIVEGAGHGDLWEFGLWEIAQAFFAAARR